MSLTGLMMQTEIQRIFRDPPILETPRLTLRRMRKADAKDMYEYACQSRVTRYLLWREHDDLNYTTRYLSYLQSRYRQGEFHDWAIVLREPGSEGLSSSLASVFFDKAELVRGKMIGTCGFTRFMPDHKAAEVGYVVNPAYWGQGIAPEAVRAVLQFGFTELHLHRIEARYMVGNDASRRVMEKVGMTFEGVARDCMFVKGNFVSVGTCAILRDEYYETYGTESFYTKIV